MNGSTKEIVINLYNKYPTACIYASKIYNRLFGNNKINISNYNNVLFELTVIKNIEINIIGKNNVINVGNLTRLESCNIYIKGNNNRIFIGENASLNETELHIEDDNNEIIIGNKTTIQGKTHLAAIEGTIINIGEDCMFSSYIHFATGDSHSIINDRGERINKSSNIFIADHVWVGTQVTVLKGTSVMKNSIIGAKSLLNKSYNHSNVIIAGNPGVIIKTNINWLRERI